MPRPCLQTPCERPPHRHAILRLRGLLADEDNSQGLPLKSDEAEFRPFVRRLPEFKFWLQAQRSVIMAFLATFFDMFNVPVFWPILVLYFFILFGVSMKQRILVSFERTPRFLS